MKKTIAAILPVFMLATAFLAVGLVSSTSRASDEKVLAVIDGEKLTRKDFDAYFALFKGNPRYTLKTRRQKEAMLTHFIDRTLLLKEAKKAGYDKIDVLKKHPTLDRVEEETIMLRAYLQDHVAKKVTVTPGEIAAYRKAHPGAGTKAARERLTARRQKVLFDTLMKRIRAKHTIRYFPENLE